MGNILGAPIVKSGWDFVNGILRSQRADRWQRDVVDQQNARNQALLDSAGAGAPGSSPIGYSNTSGASDVSFADTQFGPQAINRTANAQFGPVSRDLAALPDSINRRSRTALTAFGNQATGINRSYGVGSEAVNAGYGSLSGDVSGGYNALAYRARGIVGGISDQERLDANRSFADRTASETASLASRGLSGSTVGSSVRSGIEQDRQAEMRRISDQTAREQLAVESQFGGAGLAAQQQIGLTGLGTRASMLGTQATLASDLAGKSLAGGLDAATLASNMELQSLLQRGAISQARFNEIMAGRTTRLNTRTGMTERGTTARQNVFGTASTNYGGPTLVQPG